MHDPKVVLKVLEDNLIKLLPNDLQKEIYDSLTEEGRHLHFRANGVLLTASPFMCTMRIEAGDFTKIVHIYHAEEDEDDLLEKYNIRIYDGDDTCMLLSRTSACIIDTADAFMYLTSHN